MPIKYDAEFLGQLNLMQNPWARYIRCRIFGAVISDAEFLGQLNLMQNFWA